MTPLTLARVTALTNGSTTATTADAMVNAMADPVHDAATTVTAPHNEMTNGPACTETIFPHHRRATHAGWPEQALKKRSTKRRPREKTRPSFRIRGKTGGLAGGPTVDSAIPGAAARDGSMNTRPREAPRTCDRGL